jgi:hypothetical protein
MNGGARIASALPHLHRIGRPDALKIRPKGGISLTESAPLHFTLNQHSCPNLFTDLSTNE